MPRSGPSRTFVGLRLDSDVLADIEGIAERETEGNLSAAVRTLLAEAVAARRGQTAPVKPSAARTAPPSYFVLK